MADCCSALEKIESACKAGRATAAGFKTRLYFQCEDKITAIPAPDDYAGGTGDPHTVSSDITLESAPSQAYFIPIDFDDVQQSWEVTQEGEGQSKTFVTTASVFVPGIAPLPTYVLNGTQGGKYIVIMQDKNGNYRIIGEQDDGCTIDFTESNTDTNGYVLTVTWRSKQPPLFYTGTISVEA